MDQLIRLKQIDLIALSKHLLYTKRICVLPSRQAKWRSLKNMPSLIWSCPIYKRSDVTLDLF